MALFWPDEQKALTIYCIFLAYSFLPFAINITKLNYCTSNTNCFYYPFCAEKNVRGIVKWSLCICVEMDRNTQIYTQWVKIKQHVTLIKLILDFTFPIAFPRIVQCAIYPFYWNEMDMFFWMYFTVVYHAFKHCVIIKIYVRFLKQSTMLQ